MYFVLRINAFMPLCRSCRINILLLHFHPDLPAINSCFFFHFTCKSLQQFVLKPKIYNSMWQSCVWDQLLGWLWPTLTDPITGSIWWADLMGFLLQGLVYVEHDHTEKSALKYTRNNSHDSLFCITVHLCWEAPRGPFHQYGLILSQHR